MLKGHVLLMGFIGTEDGRLFMLLLCFIVDVTHVSVDGITRVPLTTAVTLSLLLL